MLYLSWSGNIITCTIDCFNVVLSCVILGVNFVTRV